VQHQLSLWEKTKRTSLRQAFPGSVLFGSLWPQCCCWNLILCVCVFIHQFYLGKEFQKLVFFKWSYHFLWIKQEPKNARQQFQCTKCSLPTKNLTLVFWLRCLEINSCKVQTSDSNTYVSGAVTNWCGEIETSGLALPPMLSLLVVGRVYDSTLLSHPTDEEWNLR
jgi:hypothetical protein